MFPSRKPMKWANLLKDLKEKVGLSPSATSSPSSQFTPPHSVTSSTSSSSYYSHADSPASVEGAAAAGIGAGSGPPGSASPARRSHGAASPARDHLSELDFKRCWEDFRSSSSEKEKETALNVAVDVFCKLLKLRGDAAQLTMSVEAHIFSFVVGRAFVTDIEKLRIHNKSKSLHVGKVLNFFAEVAKDGIKPGANLLYAVEALVSGPIDKQPLLDSGILCCLIHILNALLTSDETTEGKFPSNMDGVFSNHTSVDKNFVQTRRLEVEASIVHIMKALASHPGAAQSLIEDDSFQILFQMVASGSLTVFSRFRQGLVPLHTIQLYRHAMQILGLLIVNDNGSTAKYIRKHHLIKVLLTAVKDFDPENGDSAYTMSIVDMLLDCVELSHRPDAGSIRLREDIHNAHGYQYLVQFALTLSRLSKRQAVHSVHSKLHEQDNHNSSQDAVEIGAQPDFHGSPAALSPALSRLLDALVNLAQAGPLEPAESIGKKVTKSSTSRIAGQNKSDKINQENTKIRDLEAIQMLQDIFLKSDCVELQAEVLNRMFKIFSSHLDNYKVCQQLRTVPLFILNMSGFPVSLQEIILKILEYAVTVVNCVPEQELLSLCCLLQQPITSNLRQAILSFFVKLLSFDQQYKKVLREVGVLEVLIDDLKKHRVISGSDQQNKISVDVYKMSTSDNFTRQKDEKDAMLSSSKLTKSASKKFLLFEDEVTIPAAWDCLVSLIKKAEANQSSFRSASGFTLVLPLLVSEVHRSGLLRMLSCLIIEDAKQGHPEELGMLIEILKSGMVSNVLGSQFKLQNDAKCEMLGALWRILGANIAAQRVFGEATGFSLLLTTLHGFQSEEVSDVDSFPAIHMNLFSFLLRVMTAAVFNNAINRARLHTIISSQTFYDLVLESGLLCVDWEKQVIQLFLELALEIVVPPSNAINASNVIPSVNAELQSTDFLSHTLSGDFRPDQERVYNGSVVGVLIRSLLHFTAKVQLELLTFIERLASAGPFNQESLTSIGCVGLLLDMIHPYLTTSSPLLVHALRLVQVLGAYRLSTSELRVLLRYIVQMKSANSGHYLVDMMERLIQAQDTSTDYFSPAPFVELDLSRRGHASIQVPLGERTWPPAAGYSFVCWFQYDFVKDSYKEQEHVKAGPIRSDSSSTSRRNILRIFSIGAIDDGNSFYAEMYLDDSGVLTLATSNSSSLSFPSWDLDEGRWHHLAVIHSKPNALAGLFQASIAYVYINGKLRHTGKLGYSPSPIGKSLQVTIGTPSNRAKVSDLSWRIRSCYLFDEVLTSGSICFMYILGRGYKGIFRDTDLLQFVPNQACGGDSMAILDSLDAELSMVANAQRLDGAFKQGIIKVDGSGIVWDFDRLGNLALQLVGKKLIFAFDGASSESFTGSGTSSLLNLVDPLSSAASPIGGIPRFGRLSGDSYICHQSVIGDSIRAVGGMAVVLSLVEASETRDMLHMSLNILACALHQNPQNILDMHSCRGYHLLAIFLHRRMSLFDMQSLDLFFQIAACEASFLDPQKLPADKITPPLGTPEASFEDLSLPKFSDDVSSVGSQGDLDDFSALKDAYSHLSELESTDFPSETSNCIVLSNSDMVEHVLLDWTLWVAAPVPIQLSLLGFLERMVSMHWYRNHNLTLLRKINLVQHLLVTLQRGDVEVQVLEKLVILLGVILEDGFVASELELVVKFVIMTFNPPEVKLHHQVERETMGKHVIVRNMLFEMLIDLQMTITSEESLEQWHKVVSSKLITYFLDEAVHPTSMRWIMTLLGVSLASSSTFILKFRSNGGYHRLTHVLPNFYDSPEIYYILFCLIFGKTVYPRVPEVRMGDFHALMSNDGSLEELKFVELLDSVIAMAKSTFDRLSMQAILAQRNDNLSNFSVSLVAELVETTADGGDLQVEALKHKTSAPLMGGEVAAPAAATSILRFMVDLAKMCPSYSAICRRTDFLENCVDLYFSCVRAHCTVKLAKDITNRTADEKYMNDIDDNQSTQHPFSSIHQEQEQSSKTTTSIGSFPQEFNSASSEDVLSLQSSVPSFKEVKDNTVSILEGEQLKDDSQVIYGSRNACASSKSECCDNDNIFNPTKSLNTNSVGTTASAAPDSPVPSERPSSKIVGTPSSPVIAITSWLGSSGSQHEAKNSFTATSSMQSSINEVDLYSEPRMSSQDQLDANVLLPINAKILVGIDDSGYGGGPCSAGATTVLDFIAIVLADVVAEQIKGSQFVEGILEAVPLFVDPNSTLVFQGLCLGRLMTFLERRLVRDDEEDEKKLDKSRWSLNLDALSWMIVDRVYMGAFPQPVGVLRTLEFLLSMLQLANKYGRIEDAVPSGKGILSITKGGRHLEAYIYALLKNTNRMVMYCFLPPFLNIIGEDELLARLGFLNEPKKSPPVTNTQDESTINICTVLQLVVANKRLILCPSNLDTDLICCLCMNLFCLLRNHRQAAQELVLEIIRYMLKHRLAALEELLVSKPSQGKNFDILHGGFDKLKTEGSSIFFEWFNSSEHIINDVMEQSAAIMWVQYVGGSAKFPAIRIKGMEGRRRREMGRKTRDASKVDDKLREEIEGRRYALEAIRDAMSTELRVVRQDKYGWVLHAESEWQAHLQELVHERGIFPMRNNNALLDWQLSPIEGPYRMRKKLERCKLKAESIRNVLNSELDTDLKPTKDRENVLLALKSDSVAPYNPPGANANCFDEYEDSSFKDAYEYKGESAQAGWNDDRGSSINELSLHSATDFGAKSTTSVPVTDSMNAKSDLGSPRVSSAVKVDDLQAAEDTSEKELHDNGEYLIRPYLEPLEKIRFKYNCERVVGLDKHDGIFLIGELRLYVIENFYIDDSGCICEKHNEDELSVIDQALGVKKDVTGSSDFQSKASSTWGSTVKALVGGRAWAYNGGAWGKEKVCSSSNLPHPWHMWKLDSVHELLKRDYQLRPVAVEIFSMDGCNDLLVFHKKERDEVFKNLVSMNLPRNSMLDATISGLSKQESNEGSRLFKIMAKSFSKRWQSGEISNFQYLMHLNTLAGRGYSDLTQYPVFPWVLADYESDDLDLKNPKSFRKLDKPMGCQTPEGEDEFKKRYESWEDPDVPKFHYGSHYSSAGIVLFYLLRLPPFSAENQKLQGGQFDHADRLFNSVRDTWLSAAGKGNTSDVKELIPEFFYLPEFLKNRFDLDLGEKQSGEKVGDVVLPPWAKGSTREFIRKHREALESDYVSENLHHWIDLIFGYRQRGKAAEDAVNVFYHYTYEGSVDIDSVSDPAMKASILAQINHFGQTPKQLFLKAHVKRRTDRKAPRHPLLHCMHLAPREVRRSSSISQIVNFYDKILIAGTCNLLKPPTYNKYIAWGFPDRSLRFLTYDQDKLLSTHESLHGSSQIQSAGLSHDGNILVTGGDDGIVSVWRISKDAIQSPRRLQLERALCAHTDKITCLYVSQPYSLIVTGSEDCTVILWNLCGLVFVKQLPRFPAPVSAVHVNDLTGEIVTAAGILLAVWSINGDCLAFVSTSQLPSDLILSVTSATFSDWQDTNWFVTGHQSGAIKVWNMVHFTTDEGNKSKASSTWTAGNVSSNNQPEYRLILRKVLKSHKHPITALHLTTDLKQMLSGDSAGHLFSWTLPDENVKVSTNQG